MGGTRPRQVGIRQCPAHSGGLETGQELENNDAMQTLKDKLASDRFVITAEITPPVSCDAADLVAKATPLKGLADAINVTDVLICMNHPRRDQHRRGVVLADDHRASTQKRLRVFAIVP